MTNNNETSKSAYILTTKEEIIERHTFAVIVDNRSGILARVVGMFSARGYNIESLTVAPIDANKKRSRINIVTTGTAHTIAQIKAQLTRIVAVNSVANITEEVHIEKEIALIRVKATSEQRAEAIRLAEVFKVEVVDATAETFMFMIVGDNRRVIQFIDLMRTLGDIEVARSGVVAMSCGSEILKV